MSEKRINQPGMPEECIDDMQLYLGTHEIAPGEGTIRGVPCTIYCEGIGANSPLVIIAAQPMESTPWNFGRCFPELPGESEEKDRDRSFRMRFLTLRNSLWLFIWSRDGQAGQVRERILATQWFKDWAVQRGNADTHEDDLQRFFDTLGFDEQELQLILPASSDEGNGSPAAKTSRSGLFFWGDIGQTSAATEISQAVIEELPWLDDIMGFLGDFPFLFTRTRVEYKGEFPFLTIQWPPGGFDFGRDGLSFQNATIEISSIPYFTPQDTSVGIEGDFVFSEDKKIAVDLVYPIDGDLIWASGKYTRGAKDFLGDSASFGLPGSEPTYSDEEIALVLEFSKSARKLTRLSFAVDLHENWRLLDEPVPLTLEGLSCYVTIYEPMSSSRTVLAQFTAKAAFGDGSDGGEPIRLACGGSYPDGDLFLQALNSVPIGKLIEKLAGPSEGLEKLTIEDLRIGYNYRTSHLSLDLDVQEKWPIISGFEVEDVRFRFEGDKSYTGGLAASLKFARGTEHEVDVSLKAEYNDGWQFAGSTGPGQEIHIGDLIKDLGRLFGNEPQLPVPLEDLVIKDLGVSFNTNNKDFRFTCESDLPVSAQSSLAIKLFIDVTHDDKGAFQFTFSGKSDVLLEDKTLEFEITIEHAAKKDRLVAAYHHDGKLPLNVSALVCALVPGDSELTALIMGMDIAVDLKKIQIAFDKEASEPPNTSKSMFGMLLIAEVSFADPFSTGEVITVELNSLLFSSFAREAANQNGEPKATSKFLFGLKIGAELSLSDVPLVGAQLPAGQTIGVKDLQLFAASQAILPADMEQVENLLGADKLPTPRPEDPAQPAIKLEVGVTVDAILMLGAETRNLVFAPSGESPTDQERQVQAESQEDESNQEVVMLPVESAQAEKALVASENNIQPAQPSVKWIKVQKSFGPVRFDRLGFQFQNQVLWFLLDASLSAAGLTISLEGLGFGSSITQFKPEFALQGLGIDFKQDPLEISGAFLQTGVNLYSGQALIKAESFMLSAIGSYSNVKDIGTSLFIFAYLDTPLGGPPCFFVTGLAAGFGYNSSLRTPAIEQVKDFPLLAAMVDPSKIGIQKDKPANPMDVLASLNQWIQPQRGAYWLAAGISFRSFEIIKSDVLAIVEFGKEFQVLVVGFSTLQLPQEGDRIYAYAELMIEIIVKPAEGVIAAMAQLTPNSYLLDPDCHLTGGFAFFLWFGNNPNAGDFVLTIGGYHPAFKVPDHYPQVPRLGFNWPVSKTVTIKGEAYFALTPSCVMVGGKLEVLYHSGNLQAWFIAQADLIVRWKPFCFKASISVRIGVSYRVKIWFVRKTLRVELGASVELWGPPTGGRAHIKLWFISFTVSFGEGRPSVPLTVDWEGFKTMLPQRENGVQADPGVIQISVNNGLLPQVDEQNGKKRWIVRPDEFVFSVETAIPTTETRLNENPVTIQYNETIGIRPMGIREIGSPLTISIRMGDGQDPLSNTESNTEWTCEPHIRKMPEAMWGSPVNGSLKAGSELIENCMVGLQYIRHKRHANPSGPPKFVMENAFTYYTISPVEGEDIPDYLPLSPAAAESTTGFPTTNDTLQVIRDTLMEVKQCRTAVFQALVELGINAFTDGDLSTLAANPAANYEASPMIGSLVQNQKNGRKANE